MKNALVNLVNISKSFDNQMVLDDLNLYIRENEFLTLLGPSGCGKTTTLRILGGFETPDKGQVIFEGRDITNLPPNKRNLNTVFQKYALFPHTHTGNSGGQVQGFSFLRNAFFTIRSSREWKVMMQNLPPGCNRSINSSSAFFSTSSS